MSAEPPAGVIPNCHLCHHRFHGLPCKVCPCESAFIDPDQEPAA